MQDWRLFAASQGWRKCPILTQTLQPKRWLNIKAWRSALCKAAAPVLSFTALFFCFVWPRWLFVFEMCGRYSHSVQVAREGQPRLQALFAMNHRGRAQFSGWIRMLSGFAENAVVWDQGWAWSGRNPSRGSVHAAYTSVSTGSLASWLWTCGVSSMSVGMSTQCLDAGNNHCPVQLNSLHFLLRKM